MEAWPGGDILNGGLFRVHERSLCHICVFFCVRVSPMCVVSLTTCVHLHCEVVNACIVGVFAVGGISLRLRPSMFFGIIMGIMFF